MYSFISSPRMKCVSIFCAFDTRKNSKKNQLLFSRFFPDGSRYNNTNNNNTHDDDDDDDDDINGGGFAHALLLSLFFLSSKKSKRRRFWSARAEEEEAWKTKSSSREKRFTRVFGGTPRRSRGQEFMGRTDGSSGL